MFLGVFQGLPVLDESVVSTAKVYSNLFYHNDASHPLLMSLIPPYRECVLENTVPFVMLQKELVTQSSLRTKHCES